MWNQAGFSGTDGQVELVGVDVARQARPAAQTCARELRRLANLIG